MPIQNDSQRPAEEMASVAMDLLRRLDKKSPWPHKPDLADFRDAFRIYVEQIQIDAQVAQMEYLTNSAAAKDARELFLLQHSISLRDQQKEIRDKIKALKISDGL